MLFEYSYGSWKEFSTKDLTQGDIFGEQAFQIILHEATLYYCTLVMYMLEMLYLVQMFHQHKDLKLRNCWPLILHYLKGTLFIHLLLVLRECHEAERNVTLTWNFSKKKNPSFWTNKRKILENANCNFLTSVPLTRQNQALQEQAGIDLLEEVDCLSNISFVTHLLRGAEEQQQVCPAGLSHCNHISLYPTTVSRRLGKDSLSLLFVSAGYFLHSLSRSFGKTEPFPKSHTFLQNALFLCVNITFLVQKLVFLFQLLPAGAESELSFYWVQGSNAVYTKYNFSIWCVPTYTCAAIFLLLEVI